MQTSYFHIQLELLLRAGFTTQFTSVRHLTILRVGLLEPVEDPDYPIGTDHYRGGGRFVDNNMLSKLLNKYQHGTRFFIPPHSTIFKDNPPDTSPSVTPLQHLQELDEQLKSLFPQANTRIFGLDVYPSPKICTDGKELKGIWVSSKLSRPLHGHHHPSFHVTPHKQENINTNCVLTCLGPQIQ